MIGFGKTSQPGGRHHEYCQTTVDLGRGLPRHDGLQCAAVITSYSIHYTKLYELESTGLLASAAALLSERCVSGITPNRKRCQELIEQSLAMVTPLAVKIGYDKAAQLAHEAYHSGKTIRAILTERQILPVEEITKILA